MIKITIIPCLFVLVLSVTIVNLFYKPHWYYGGKDKRGQDFQFWMLAASASDPFTNVQCSLRGFRCPDVGNCDCKAACPDHNFRKFQVGKDDDDIIVLDHKLEPGSYCLPEQGVVDCHRKHQLSIYSLSGWTCVDRNRHVFDSERKLACKHPLAQDDNLNVIVDELTGRMVDDDQPVEDFHERLADGSRRYQCHCDSLDLYGNRMIRTLPFVCSVDYCVRDLRNVPTLGWDGQRCNCGPFPHEDSNDELSACVREKTRIENYVLNMRVDCTDRTMYERKAWHCPGGVDGILPAHERVAAGPDPTTFLRTHYQNFAEV